MAAGAARHVSRQRENGGMTRSPCGESSLFPRFRGGRSLRCTCLATLRATRRCVAGGFARGATSSARCGTMAGRSRARGGCRRRRELHLDEVGRGDARLDRRLRRRDLQGRDVRRDALLPLRAARSALAPRRQSLLQEGWRRRARGDRPLLGRLTPFADAQRRTTQRFSTSRRSSCAMRSTARRARRLAAITEGSFAAALGPPYQAISPIS